MDQGMGVQRISISRIQKPKSGMDLLPPSDHTWFSYGVADRQSWVRQSMTRRYQPAQLAAAIIIGLLVAIVILILYRGVWL
jgi:hypothetical protein